MVKSRTDIEANPLIWRISADHPHGVFIPASIRPVKPARLSELRKTGFDESSHDLLNGAEVTETSMDTLPSELAEAFKRNRDLP